MPAVYLVTVSRRMGCVCYSSFLFDMTHWTFAEKLKMIFTCNKRQLTTPNINMRVLTTSYISSKTKKEKKVKKAVHPKVFVESFDVDLCVYIPRMLKYHTHETIQHYASEHGLGYVRRVDFTPMNSVLEFQSELDAETLNTHYKSAYVYLYGYVGAKESIWGRMLSKKSVQLRINESECWVCDPIDNPTPDIRMKDENEAFMYEMINRLDALM